MQFKIELFRVNKTSMWIRTAPHLFAESLRFWRIKNGNIRFHCDVPIWSEEPSPHLEWRNVILEIDKEAKGGDKTYARKV